MIKRCKSRVVNVGSIKLGGKNPIIVQSMTKVPTTDVAKCVRQVNALVASGCGIVRIAVPTRKDTQALAKIVDRVDIPIVADVHFSPDRAIEAIEAGAAKIRLNPGNIKNRADVLQIIDAAKANNVAIRAGVNEASIRDLKTTDITPARRVKLMVAELRKYVRLFEKRNFTNLVLSAKSADTIRTIEVNRALAEAFEWPIHLGLTHAGLPQDATVPSAVAIGTLLAEGIGDTIRVSVAGNPTAEGKLGHEILRALDYSTAHGPELVVCPTCGRCQVNVVKLAKDVRKAIAKVNKPIHVAVMGCIVNGPGEAADADIAVCAAKGKGYIYKQGKKIKTVQEDQLLKKLLQEIESF